MLLELKYADDNLMFCNIDLVVLKDHHNNIIGTCDGGLVTIDYVDSHKQLGRTVEVVLMELMD